MSLKIIEALQKLDVDNDNHWTEEGLPRLDVLKDIIGETVSRVDVTNAAKTFTRKNPVLEQVQVAPLKTTFSISQDGTVNTNTEAKALEGVADEDGTEVNFNSYLENALVAANLDLHTAELALAEARQNHLDAVKRRDSVLEKMSETGPVDNLQTTISAYLAAQNRMAGIE